MDHRPLTNTYLKFKNHCSLLDSLTMQDPNPPEDVPAKDPTSPEYVPARSVCFISKL